MKQIINDCLISAKENPFVLHYIIVDDPKYYEEIFLKQTKLLYDHQNHIPDILTS